MTNKLKEKKKKKTEVKEKKGKDMIEKKGDGVMTIDHVWDIEQIKELAVKLERMNNAVADRAIKAVGELAILTRAGIADDCDTCIIARTVELEGVMEAKTEAELEKECAVVHYQHNYYPVIFDISVIEEMNNHYVSAKQAGRIPEKVEKSLASVPNLTLWGIVYGAYPMFKETEPQGLATLVVLMNGLIAAHILYKDHLILTGKVSRNHPLVTT